MNKKLFVIVVIGLSFGMMAHASGITLSAVCNPPASKTLNWTITNPLQTSATFSWQRKDQDGNIQETSNTNSSVNYLQGEESKTIVTSRSPFVSVLDVNVYVVQSSKDSVLLEATQTPDCQTSVPIIVESDNKDQIIALQSQLISLLQQIIVILQSRLR